MSYFPETPTNIHISCHLCNTRCVFWLSCEYLQCRDVKIDEDIFLICIFGNQLQHQLCQLDVIWSQSQKIEPWYRVTAHISPKHDKSSAAKQDFHPLQHQITKIEPKKNKTEKQNTRTYISTIGSI